MNASSLPFDVFLSHSSKDKPIVRAIAERLRNDGLRVWFDDWEIRPGDSIPRKLDEGLERSSVLVLCMSANSLGSDWTELESQTFRFRDPVNRQLRFIPLRLDDTEPRATLRQFAYVDWRDGGNAEAYARLIGGCRRHEESALAGQVQLSNAVTPDAVNRPVATVLNGHTSTVFAVAISEDGRRAVSASADHTIRVWDLDGKAPTRVVKGHKGAVLAIALSADGGRAVSGSHDRTVRVWDLDGDAPPLVLQGHSDSVFAVALSPDGKRAVSGAADNTIRVWDLEGSMPTSMLEGHTDSVFGVALSAGGKIVISGSADMTVRVWDLDRNEPPRVLESHNFMVYAVALSAQCERVAYGCFDNTIRVWALNSGAPNIAVVSADSFSDDAVPFGELDNSLSPSVLEGHTEAIRGVALSANGKRLLSASDDKTVRVWDLDGTAPPRVLEGHTDTVYGVAVTPDGRRGVSGARDKSVRVWDLEGHSQQMPAEERIRYTNAKVVLVGDSGSGKTGMSVRLAHDLPPARWPSTSGVWATQWPLKGMPVESGWDREVWLWDFGGQADQRLIHQLYLDRTAAVLLMFDADKESVLPGLREWQQALSRCVSTNVPVFLLAGRTDVGDRFDHAKVAEFAQQSGYVYLETSAETNRGVPELRNWLTMLIPWRTLDQYDSPARFKRMKDEILRIRDEGKVALATFKEVESELTRRLFKDFAFTPDELRTVISLLDGPGVVKEIDFGAYVLLRPEWINIYAQAVIRTLRAAESGLGYLPVRSILEGRLLFQPQQADGQPEEEKRLAPADEQIVLHSMEGTLLARRLCLRQGGDLVFPSYCGRERPEGPVPLQYFVSYTIHGFLDDIYATLVVCLAHCGAFHLAELWRDAADFKTVGQKKTLGIRLLRREDGRGELIAHASSVSQEEQVLFANYIHEHLNEKSTTPVERLRRYNCPNCGEPVMNRELAMERLQKSGAEAKIRCQRCDNWVPLWDDLETLFASPVARAMVEELRNLEQGELDARRKGKLLFLAVAAHILRADQKYIEVPGNQDEGIDLELEATENGRGTGKKMFLQLKAGNSHLQTQPDGTEIFMIEEQGWVESWSLFSEVGPVMLVIGTFAASGDRGTTADKWSFDQIRWMEIGQALRTLSNSGTISVTEIPFKGTRLDDQEVYRWTRNVLSGSWRDK